MTRLGTTAQVPDADAMRRLGARVAGVCRAGDVVVLDGPLGAGKTTFTQGFAEGLGVVGPVTSPTFVIARVHRAASEGPSLVHVDAYRLTGLDEVDDLDLDASVDDSVTVVEWGEGLVERLGEQVVVVRIERDLVGTDGDAGGVDDARRVTVVLPEGRAGLGAGDQ